MRNLYKNFEIKTNVKIIKISTTYRKPKFRKL